jgi:HAD superfamily hydrolase (TIGR01509 family)
MPIKAILFDLGNVLICYDALKTLEGFVSSCEVDAKGALEFFYKSELEKEYTRGKITSMEFYDHCKAELKFKMGFSEFKKYWSEIFWENEGMKDVLIGLKEKGYSLYLISNTNEMHYDYIEENFDILTYFDGLFPSHLIGERKPDVEIFQKVLLHIGLEPEETIFIDDQEDFIEGAKKAKIPGILFKNKNQLLKELLKFNINL